MTIRVNYFSIEPTLGCGFQLTLENDMTLSENKTLKQLQADCLNKFVMKEAISKDSKIFKKDPILVKNAFS